MLIMVMMVQTGFATWSIIVIDSVTKQIGIAGASCTHSVYGIGGIVPGKGAVIVQAMSNIAAKRKGLEMIERGVSTREILLALMDPVFMPEQQQYAIATIEDFNSPLNYTGSENNTAKAGLSAKGITVQGNTLVSEKLIREVMDAALSARSKGAGVEETLMIAMEAGAAAGGDKRCGERTASSAFMTVTNATDNKDHPSVNLVVSGLGNRQNAITELRKRYDNWKRRH